MYCTSMQMFTLLPARRLCKALHALTHCDSISIIDTETPPYMRWAKDLVKLVSKAGLGTFFSPFHHNQSILHLQILHHQRMYQILLICTSMFPAKPIEKLKKSIYHPNSSAANKSLTRTEKSILKKSKPRASTIAIVSKVAPADGEYGLQRGAFAVGSSNSAL